jgi:hypothetical protein
VSRESEAIATTKTLKMYAFSDAEVGAGRVLMQSAFITRRVSEGFSPTLLNTQKHDPSLTQRVGIVANSQLQN